jgi:beta-lactam-binding protein with PASTA domain
MKIIRWLTDLGFFKWAVRAAGITVVLTFILMQWLKYNTHHDQKITVPDLSGMALAPAASALTALDLRYAVVDSTKYNPNHPPYSVIEQFPAAGSFVKEKRQIYLTMNAAGYSEVAVPLVVQVTLRNATSRLTAAGFKVGNIEYIDALGTDMVYEVLYRGKTLKSGQKIPQMSSLTLVVGNGNKPLEEQ